MNIVSLCILYDNKTQVHSALSSPFSSLGQCLASRIIDKPSKYFVNPVNARVKVSDLTVLCQFVDHKGYASTQFEQDMLSHLMFYLKCVLCYNLEALVYDGDAGKLGADGVLKKCHESFDVGGSGVRNQHLLDMVQLVNFYSAYQLLTNQSAKTSELQQKLIKERSDCFCLLYSEHQSLLKCAADERVHKMYETIISGPPLGTNTVIDKATPDCTISPNKAIDPIDIEELTDSLTSNKEISSYHLPTDDEINSSTISGVEKKIIIDFYKRYREFVDWQSHIKRKTPSSLKKLREDYKKIPITRGRLEETIRSIVESSQKQHLIGLMAMIDQSSESIAKRLQDVWTNWKGSLTRQTLGDQSCGQIYTEMAKIEDRQISEISGLMASEGYYRKDAAISLIFDKLEIASHILDVLKLVRDDKALRSKKSLDKLCAPHLDRINMLVDRFSHSTDQREIKTLSIWTYLEDVYNIVLDKNSKSKGDKGDGKRKHRSKSPIQSKSQRSHSTNLRKRSPMKDASKDRTEKSGGNVESSSSTDRASIIAKKTKDAEKGSSSTSKARDPSKPRSRGGSKSPGSKSPKASQKGKSSAGLSKSVRSVSVSKLQRISKIVSPGSVQIKLNMSLKTRYCLEDIQLVLKNYKLDPFLNNEALLLVAKAKIMYQLKASRESQVKSMVPAAVKCITSDQLTMKDLTIIMRIRDQIVSGFKEIKQASSEYGKLANIELELKTLVCLCIKYVFAFDSVAVLN